MSKAFIMARRDAEKQQKLLRSALFRKPAGLQRWRGIHKLNEEMGELQQVIGKLLAFPDGPHPDGKGSLKTRFMEEAADVYAALDYVIEQAQLRDDLIQRRRKSKLKKFYKWVLTGISL